MAGFERAKQSLDIQAVPQQRVDNLQQDLSNLMGVATKGAQAYNTIGETAAKIDLSDKMNTYNDELAKWNEASVGKDKDTQFWESYHARINELTSSIVSESEKYSNHKAAYDVYSSLSKEYAVGIRSKLTPSISESLLKSTQLNQIDKTSTTFNKANKTGIPISPSLIKTESSIYDGMGLDKTKVPDLAFVNTDDYINKEFSTDVSKFLRDNNLSISGKLNRAAIPALVDKYFGNFATVNQGGQLVSNQEYTTNEHLEKIGKFIGHIESAFDKEGDTPNYQFRSVNSSIDSNKNKAMSGTQSVEESEAIVKEGATTLSKFDGILGKSDYKAQQQQYQDLSDSHKININLQNLVSENIYDRKITDMMKLGVSTTIRSKSVADGTEVNVQKVVSPEQVKSAVTRQVSLLENGVVTNGVINSSKLKVLTMASANTGVITPLVESAIKYTMTGAFPESYTKQQAKNDIAITYAALTSKVKMDSIVQQTVTTDYLNNLNSRINGLKEDPKNPSVFISELNTAKNDTATTHAVSSSMDSFILKNYNTVSDKIAKDTQGYFNKYLEFGDTEHYNAQNTKEYLKLYGVKYGLLEPVSDDKLKEITKDNSYDFGSSIPFFGNNYKLPYMYSKAYHGKPIEVDKVDRLISSVLQDKGIKNKFSPANVSVYVSSRDGESYVTIEARDKDQNIASTDTFSGTEIESAIDWRKKDFVDGISSWVKGKSEYKVSTTAYNQIKKYRSRNR